MGRAPCCEKVGLKKGPWTLEEDQKLTAYVNEHGHGSWRALPKKAGLLRCGKSCRLRWTNYLRPDIKRGEFSSSEEQTIIQLHALLGNRWSSIATHLPKRTDNEIKNYWNTHLKKRLIKMGLDPATHKPQTSYRSSNNTTLLEPTTNNTNTSSTSSITHMAQWESVRLEAEARLAKEAEMRAKGLWQPSPSSSSARPIVNAEEPHVKLDAPASSDRLASLKRICGSVALPAKDEKGSCDALDCTKCSTDGLLMSLKQNRSALMTSLKQETSNTAELMNSLHNWENSLQGQAGMMWPDSWKLCNNLSSGEGQESSSCSSPSHGTTYGSPTSTLSSLEQLAKHYYNSNPSTQARKLYWCDNYLRNASNHSIKPFSFAQVEEDGMQGGASKSSSVEGSFLGVPCLQELMQSCEGFINNRSGEESLLMVSNSGGFLGDLELVSEDISSSHEPSSSGDVSRDDIQQISYSALLGEEYPDSEWNSVLKETEGTAAMLIEDQNGGPLL